MSLAREASNPDNDSDHRAREPRRPSKTVLCVVGTRPEAIKMAPVVRAFRDAPWARCRLVFTAQHRELVDPMFRFFEIAPDRDLDVMRPDQNLVDLTCRLLQGLDRAFHDEKPDVVLAQGDTTTVLAAALAAFYRRVPFAHVEAGLRTGDLARPFPEEGNRVLAGHLAALHFAPTPRARDALLREGVDPRTVRVTGNTVIDALHWAAERDVPIGVDIPPDARLVLVTAHRRDSFGQPMRQICEAVADLARQHPEVRFLWPVHPNPAVKSVVEARLAEVPNVLLVPPLEYGALVSALKRCELVLTDSGGIQEEAPALGKPVLVLRHESERPEAVAAGAAKLVGPVREAIVAETNRLLDQPAALRAMSRPQSPYGDGRAALRVVRCVAEALGVPRADTDTDTDDADALGEFQPSAPPTHPLRRPSREPARIPVPR